MPSLNEKSIIALAKQGDAGAIAIVLNYYFSARQIEATVSWQEDDLTVVLKGPQVPDRAKAIAPIQHIFKKLNLADLAQVRVYGQQATEDQFAWREDIVYRSKPTPAASPPPLSDWLNQGLATPASAPAEPPSAPVQTHRLLRFGLVNQQTALLDLSQIQEVIQISPSDILPVPQMADCIIGVCSHRDTILWLVDCNQQLGLPSVLMDAVAARLTIVVVQQGDRRLGLVIPETIGIETYDDNQILPPKADRFSANLLPFVQGSLANSTSPILKGAALVQDSRLQVH